MNICYKNSLAYLRILVIENNLVKTPENFLALMRPISLENTEYLSFFVTKNLSYFLDLQPQFSEIKKLLLQQRINANECINRIHKEDCDINQYYNCNSCNFPYCFLCDYTHKGQTCDEFNKAREGSEAFKDIFLEANTFQQCPSCRTPVEKNGGCSHMRCQKCKHDWDWIKDRVAPEKK